MSPEQNEVHERPAPYRGVLIPLYGQVHERLAKAETGSFMMETHIQEILTRVERIETEEMVNVQIMATQHAKALEEEVEARAVLEGNPPSLPTLPPENRERERERERECVCEREKELRKTVGCGGWSE